MRHLAEFFVPWAPLRAVWVLLCLTAAIAAAETIAPALLQEDFRILRSALEEGHPGLYRYTPKAEMDRIFDKTAAGLKQPMTELEFYRVVAPVVAALKCGHTPLMISEASGKTMQESVALFPAQVRVLNNKVYVFRDYTEGGRLTGAEIQSINGVAAETLLKAMLATIHGDGDTPTAGPWRIGRNLTFATQLYLLMGIESPFKVSYKLAGKSGEATLQGVSDTKLREIAKTRFPQDGRAASNATFRLLNKDKVGVLKIYGFGGKAEDGKPLGEFIQSAYNQLHEKNVPNLIIDVRDNGGGADELGKQLFSYLATEPFPYYDDLVIRKLTFDFFRYARNPQPIPEADVQKRPNGQYLLNSHPNWGTQQPGKPPYAGKVFALMNGGSFSTTCEFLSTLHNHHQATFIGEEAAGGYYGNTSGPGALLVLPNSKLRVPVRLMTYYMAIPGTKYGNRSIPPDHPVSYSIDELLAGKDKEMDRALELIAR